jgi:UDP-GlcNAc:undecaprenyl-phosphate GlcNAc-1-phosphate transferase
LIDRPKLRGVHGEPVARSGGLTIAAALLCAVSAQMIVARALGVESAWLQDSDAFFLILPALLLVAVGVVDDIKPMGAPPKLAVQAVAALAAWSLGFRIDVLSIPGMAEFSIGWMSLPLTLIFIVAVTNAFNMIDGVDGLCSGTAGLALAGITAFALMGGMPPLLALPLCVAALAFLRQNLSRQRAFLGDSGSMLLGFMIATLALQAVVAPSGALAVLPLFMLLSLPVVDITVTFFRRVIQGSNPLRADRGHIHHIMLLLSDGNSRHVTLTLTTMAAVGVAGAVACGVHPTLLPLTALLPLALYATVYACGGYLSWENLRNAGPATELALTLAELANEHGTGRALEREELIRLLKYTGITGIALFNEQGRRVWGAGKLDPRHETLTMPLYAAGRVRFGRLHLQGPGSAGRMAFAAHLLQPLYTAFMEALDVEVPEVPATAKLQA